METHARMKRPRLTLWGLVGTAVLAIACGLPSDNAGSSNGRSGGADQPGKIGEPVRDGKLEFTVRSVKCGAAKVGSDPSSEKAQGQFCLVTMNVRNIGQEPQTLYDDNQLGYDAGGAEYKTNSMAGLMANEDNDVWLTEINPSNEITGVIVFDIPKAAKLLRLELHDSAFSGGVTVELA